VIIIGWFTGEEKKKKKKRNEIAAVPFDIGKDMEKSN